MRNTRRVSAIAFMLAGPFIVGIAGSSVAAATPSYPLPVAATTLFQPVAEGFSPVQRAPKKITITVRCDQVKNGTPANGHSTQQVEGTGRAFNRADAQKLAEKDVDSKMPAGYHKRHCHVI
ncbi:hypothetical protein [Nocardia suismassiliense]|uniref:hypothetical protein n=1 Tax=Nocardia suismassiliense TaxID=2077092 RepID=UPI00131EFD37|nr:hypothetical protein [Nocardia suismassiliense]